MPLMSLRAEITPDDALAYGRRVCPYNDRAAMLIARAYRWGGSLRVDADRFLHCPLGGPLTLAEDLELVELFALGHSGDAEEHDLVARLRLGVYLAYQGEIAQLQRVYDRARSQVPCHSEK